MDLTTKLVGVTHKNHDMLGKRLHPSVLLINPIIATLRRYQTAGKKYQKAMNCGIPGNRTHGTFFRG